jgi:hypothetical protein
MTPSRQWRPRLALLFLVVSPVRATAAVSLFGATLPRRWSTTRTRIERPDQVRREVERPCYDPAIVGYERSKNFVVSRGIGTVLGGPRLLRLPEMRVR